MDIHDVDHSGVDQRIRDEIARLLLVPVERVTPAASLDADLGVDSLLHMNMVIGLERHFDIELPDRDAARLKNVADVVQVVRTRLAGRTGAVTGTNP